MGEIWGLNAHQVAEVLMRKTTEEELNVLSELDEFNFDNI